MWGSARGVLPLDHSTNLSSREEGQGRCFDTGRISSRRVGRVGRSWPRSVVGPTGAMANVIALIEALRFADWSVILVFEIFQLYLSWIFMYPGYFGARGRHCKSDSGHTGEYSKGEVVQ